MKELPILFSAPMVRAILEDRKGQTRRPIIPRFGIFKGCLVRDIINIGRTASGQWILRACDGIAGGLPCPFGQAGDRLWVREAWALHHEYKAVAGFAATDDPDQVRKTSERKADGSPRWRPSIHMPRWASRIDLEVTGVRVERLQNITAADIIAEGIADPNAKVVGGLRIHDPVVLQQAWRESWDAIYPEASWETNPWVWVPSFRRVVPTMGWKAAVAMAATLEPEPAGGRIR